MLVQIEATGVGIIIFVCKTHKVREKIFTVEVNDRHLFAAPACNTGEYSVSVVISHLITS